MNDPCDLAHEETIRHEQFLNERQREQQRVADNRPYWICATCGSQNPISPLHHRAVCCDKPRLVRSDATSGDNDQHDEDQYARAVDEGTYTGPYSQWKQEK